MKAIAEYIKSDRFMSANLGWTSGLFLALYWSIPALILRAIFGAHTLTQFGTEIGVFALAMFVAYMLGFYPLPGMLTTKRPLSADFPEMMAMLPPDKADAIRQMEQKSIDAGVRRYSGKRVLFFSCAAAVAMWFVGSWIGHYVPGTFTSTFWLIVYAIGTGLMAWTGADDHMGEVYTETMRDCM